MNTLHIIADWFDEIDIPPETANCVWLLACPEITFDRKNLSDTQYQRILTGGKRAFAQADHNLENLVGYHTTETNALQIRVNNCLTLDPNYKYRALHIDPTGVWINPTTEFPTPNENMVGGIED